MENGLRQNYLIAVTIGAIASKNRSTSEILEETRKNAAAIADVTAMAADKSLGLRFVSVRTS